MVEFSGCFLLQSKTFTMYTVHVNAGCEINGCPGQPNNQNVGAPKSLCMVWTTRPRHLSLLWQGN